MAIDGQERLKAACEAFLWTHLPVNNPEIELTEGFLACAVQTMIDGGASLRGGILQLD